MLSTWSHLTHSLLKLKLEFHVYVSKDAFISGANFMWTKTTATANLHSSMYYKASSFSRKKTWPSFKQIFTYGETHETSEKGAHNGYGP